ncbi:transcription factor GAGA-like isoform X3 [Leptopilina heterotoma]|uniref:transcription factor GAGA-like isoform X3 n=1 Tax=Leptopilina heterotoma TaxID=63436 RepID=UPI001CA7BCD2|nr:transcription factor GAGA-like isoform X3 [Leptopilina heterotoma]
MGSSGQLYSLSWGEFGSSLASAVQIFQGHGDLVDVTLAAGGRSFAAHKIVLSAASPFLLKLLKSTPCEHPVVMLAGIGAEDLETILEFVYRGEVRVEPSQLPSLLQAANCLNIHGLTPPTIVPDKVEEKEPSTNVNEKTEEITSPSVSSRKRKRKRKQTSSSSSTTTTTATTATTTTEKIRKIETSDREMRYLERANNRNNEYNRKNQETSDDGMDHRDSELNRGPSPSSLVRPVPMSENLHQESTSDSEPPLLHTLMPMQPYSPLHIPQFPASLGIGFPPISCVTQNQSAMIAAAAAAASSLQTTSGKIRGASDCPGVCPLCGATLRQARNLRRHLLSSCKYRLNSFAGLRSHSPSDSMMIEVKPEMDVSNYSSTQDNSNCEQIVCKPSLPSPSTHVSPHRSLSSPTIAR